MNDNRASRIEEPPSARVRSGTNPAHRILVVDDDISVRQLTTEVLAHSGYDVDTAEDGAAAWDTLQINSYHLLVTDHNMPKLSGIELLKKLRAARMALPTILVSGAMPTEELNRHPWLQIEARLLKPYTIPEFVGNGERSSARDRRCSRADCTTRLAKPAARSWFTAMTGETYA